MSFQVFYDAAIFGALIAGRLLATPKNAEQTIKSFADLPKGWDYGEGGPIAKPVIDAALEWNSFLSLQGFRTDAFPGAEGEISVSASVNDHYLEVIVEDDEKVSVAYDYQRKQVFYELRRTPEEAREIVFKVMGKIWSVSTLPIRANIMQQIIGGAGPPLRTIRALYQSSDAIVSLIEGQPSANTFVTILDMQQALSAPRRFFGDSIPIASRELVEH
jgi:hypothetical protein